MTASLNPAAPHHLPAFITAPGETDTFMVVMAVFLIIAVMAVGLLFLRLHTLPERMAHRSHKLQFEIVAVLGLLALFTHMHIFWVAGLLLALIDIPDFGNPLRRIAGSVEKIAGLKPGQGAAVEPEEVSGDLMPIEAPGEGAVEVPKTIPLPRTPKERTHA
jgi:NADH:ubiquinone oxidoreductase subunit 5 (subunit L)/multisubunit Na+/H+ antiporter MnhA subunit